MFEAAGLNRTFIGENNFCPRNNYEGAFNLVKLSRGSGFLSRCVLALCRCTATRYVVVVGLTIIHGFSSVPGRASREKKWPNANRRDRRPPPRRFTLPRPWKRALTSSSCWPRRRTG